MWGKGVDEQSKQDASARSRVPHPVLRMTLGLLVTGIRWLGRRAGE